MSEECPHGVRRTWVCATCENEATDKAVAEIVDMIPRAKVRALLIRAMNDYVVERRQRQNDGKEFHYCDGRDRVSGACLGQFPDHARPARGDKTLHDHEHLHWRCRRCGFEILGPCADAKGG